jgi:hypothetical protein
MHRPDVGRYILCVWRGGLSTSFFSGVEKVSRAAAAARQGPPGGQAVNLHPFPLATTMASTPPRGARAHHHGRPRSSANDPCARLAARARLAPALAPSPPPLPAWAPAAVDYVGNGTTSSSVDLLVRPPLPPMSPTPACSSAVAPGRELPVPASATPLDGDPPAPPRTLPRGEPPDRGNLRHRRKEPAARRNP